jgi:hypothetical protein
MSTIPEKVMVTAQATDGIAPGTLVATPPGAPDLVLVPMTKLRQIAVRTVRTYLQSLVGFLLVTGTGVSEAVGINIPATDFAQLLLNSAGLSLAPAVIALLQNLIELMSDLDNPKTRA